MNTAPERDITAPVEVAPSATPTGATVSAHNWGWRHAGRNDWALNNITFSIQPGEKVLLLGASGSGKSTLMSALAGLLDDQQEGDAYGKLHVNGEEPRKQRGHIGLVMQDPEAQVVLRRVGDDVAFGCENQGIERQDIWTRVHHALDTVGADFHLHHHTAQLSGGQKQRLALAAILAMRPQLILLDEPTANLDPQGVQRVREATEKIFTTTNATAIIVEHRINVWADLIDRVIAIVDGHIIADGPLDQILSTHREQLQAAGIWLPHDGNNETPALHPTQNINTTTPHASNTGQTNILEQETHTRTPFHLGEKHTQPEITVTQRAISAENLAIGYEADQPIRTGINLSIPKGCSTCITGTNGSGKTTLALTLAGLLAPINGHIKLDENLRPENEKSSPYTWTSTELLGRIAYVFQEPEYQFLTTSVREELQLGPALRAIPEERTQALVHEYLDKLKLTHLANAHPMTLSGGEKRRLSVATALITQPDILILDEPTFGQDKKTWDELVDLLKHAQDAGTTIISVTHDGEFIRKMGDIIINLDELGSPGEGKLRTQRRVSENSQEKLNLRTGEASQTVKTCERNTPTKQPPNYGGAGPIRHVNALARVLGLLIMTTPIVVSVDLVSAGVALALELALVPLTRIKLTSFLTRIGPLFIAAPVAAASMLLYGTPGGEIYWQYGPATISDNSIILAGSIVLRIFAMAIPALVIFPSIDPTDLADGLTQILKLPARPVIASIAAGRMVGLMLEDWAALKRARRVRGMPDGFGPKAFFRSAFALLVFALRRSAKLSLTMEARGFGSATKRTYARVSRLSRYDYIMLAISGALPVMYISAAVWAGTFVLFGFYR